MPALISVVIPAYDESACVDELARRLALVADACAARYTFEIIVVENGSRDDTYTKLLAIREHDARFKIVQLSRNFQMEGGMIAGLSHARGEACVIMSADLQDPPEMIPALLEQWEAGYENVYTIVTRRSDESLFRRFAANTFYRIINRVSDSPVPMNASDFRLVDRALYEAFNDLSERYRMVRATWGWLGFRSIGIEYVRPPRHGGTSTFNAFVTASYAIKGILASSFAPLKVIPLFGLTLSAFSFLLLAAIIVRAIFFGVPFNGFGTIIGVSLLLFGFLFLLLGLVSEYVGMIFHEVRGRPLFVERLVHGFDTAEPRANGAAPVKARRATKTH